MLWVKQHPALIAFIACVVFFLIFPETDLAVARWFYDPASGFFLNDHFLVQTSYRVFADIHWFIFFLLLWLLFASWYWRKTAEVQLRKKLLFMLLVLILGPGLVVSALKDHAGRPRPSQVSEFNGASEFKPAFVVSQECDRNCSFVSGHAAIAFYMICLAWVLRDRRWLWAGIMLGSYAGIGRMAQGSHYLSDVVFSFWVVFGVCSLLANWLLKPDQPAPS